jgi:hypothetical protein
MKKYFFAILIITYVPTAKAGGKDSTIYYNLPDSVKAVQFMADITVNGADKKTRMAVGIKTNTVSLFIQKFPFGSGGRISFSCPSYSNLVATGTNTMYDRKSQTIGWNYIWKLNETYRLIIAQATDSAGNFSLYSGYVFLPRENKWKLIGTCKIKGRWHTIQQPAFYYSNRGKEELKTNAGQVWIQRSNGSWKNLKNETLPNPTINWFGHLDSAQQRRTDIEIIENAIASGKTDVKNNEQGVYYTMMKEGTGRQVTVNDTVTVFYKGYLFANDSVFDQTKDKPATFPLKRLIRGWQIGVPLCKVGGRIKLVIPPELGYSIRTRAAKIPPNSILVFEIEVLDAKATEQQPGN